MSKKRQQIPNTLQLLITCAIIVMLSVLSIGSQFYDVFALSSSFPRYYVADGMYVRGTVDQPYSGNVDEYNSASDFDNLPIDIRSASYLSDGRTLNATVWLSTPLYEERHLDYVDSNIKFEMDIRIEYEYDDTDPLYRIHIQPERDGTWTRITTEHSPWISDISEQKNKTIETIHNYTGFFENGKSYIDFTLDLHKIGFPHKYWITFNNFANKDGMPLEDFIYSMRAPPPIGGITFNWPNIMNPVELRPGETRSIDILVNSTDLFGITNYTLTDADKTDNITVNFDPQSFFMPINGVNNVKMIIEAAENTPIGSNALPVSINEITSEGVPGSWNETFDVQIRPSLPPVEKVSNTIQANGPLSASMPLVITSIVGLGLVRYINTKSSSFALSSLNSAEVLAIDASIIVGVLIFLTIGGAEFGSNNVNLTTNSATNLDSSENSNDDIYQANNSLTVGLLTASIVYPFAISAIRVVIKGSAEPGLKFMIIGFVYLMIAVVIIAFLNQ